VLSVGAGAAALHTRGMDGDGRPAIPAVPPLSLLMQSKVKTVKTMTKHAAVISMALAIVTGVSAHERDFLARFDGGIGVNPVANVAGPANADGTFPNVKQNVVRGVLPAGPWKIDDLKASVDVYGRIRVRGRGLLLANGNAIGQNANAKVFATLICEAAAPFVEHSTDLAGVALEPDGDFRIDDTLNPAPPAECASPALLIRVSGAGVWFAAGIPTRGDN
jgi:hypothetical protein